MEARRALQSDSKQNEGVRSHCQRVATWGRELGNALGLSESDHKLLAETATHHHFPEILIEDAARHRLLADMGVAESDGLALIPEDVRRLLLVFWKRNPIAGTSMGKLAAVLEICDDFDQFFESEALLEHDGRDKCVSSSVETMLSYMQLSSRADVSRVIDRLPVFPDTAIELVRTLTKADLSVDDLAPVASRDPVLAGLVVQSANSGYYTRRTPVKDIGQALSYIGVEASRNVMLGATLRPIYSSQRSRPLWNHSLDVAGEAQRLAARSSLKIDPSEVFLAGLVHDVGRLAFSIMPPSFLERFYRLTGGGCTPVQVEHCLSGLCHGEVGAEALTQWNFAEDLVEAVHWHHRPERSRSALASLLYLAESVTGGGEDLPSRVRLNAACQQAGIRVETLDDIDDNGTGYLESLRFAA